MYYKTRDPFTSFDEIAHRVNKIGAKLINDFENGITIEKAGVFTPRIDLIEEADRFVVFAELPGVGKEDISLNLNEEGKLTLRGKKIKADVPKDTTQHRTERSFGEFERVLMIPDTANTEAVSAKYDNGVLEISIAKKEPVKPKEVKIDIL